MKHVINTALDAISVSGLDYGDIRVVNRTTQNLSTRNTVVEAVESTSSLGFGIRVLYRGFWGFGASNDLSSQSIKETAKKALQIAKASASVGLKKVKLYPVKPVQAKYQTPLKIDPFTVSLNTKINTLLSCDKIMVKVKNVTTVQSFMRSWREEKIFASTEGAYIEQILTETGAGFDCLATDGKEAQNRSFPNSFRGQFKTCGYELLDELKLHEHAQQIAEEAVLLLKAKECPAGEFDIILDGNQLALQIHESCGHPTELDRVLGYEAAYAGTSFMNIDGLGKLKYGSDIVNLTADSITPGGLGTFGFDDEGVPAGKHYLVKNGIHVGYLTSRETLPVLINKVKNKKSKAQSNIDLTLTSAMRADGWSNIPLVRMVNVSLEPGIWKYDDLISDTKYGLLMSTNRSWSIDDRRINFQFGTEIAYEIKNGKKTGRIFKNPIYSGITPSFWNSCDAICNKESWTIWGTPNCGKGEPSQLAHTGHGASPARFRKVRVGR
jgi:TldD protein